MSPYVLIFTASYDMAAERVLASLAGRGVRALRFNADEFPARAHVTVDESGHARFVIGDRQVNSEEISAVWYRRHPDPSLPEMEAGLVDLAHRETRALLTGALLLLDAPRWVSHPTALWVAEKKPLQLKVAAQLGFQIPLTRMTNSPAEVRSLSVNRRLVAKAVSSGYIRRSDGNAAVFTSRVSDADLRDLDSLALAPVIFQQEIDKQSDVRVTVVGDMVFAAEIMSQADDSSRTDWRATRDPNLEHRRITLPSDVQSRCVALVRRLNLKFGAIDLVRTSTDEYLFLEINPNGEWLWIEDLLGYPIGDAIASELVS